MTRIIAIRPEPGLSATVKSAREFDLEVFGEPLFEIRSVPWQCPAPETIDALLIGSANAILHGGDQLSALTAKPVHAVGDATAKAARDRGFTVASVGSGGLQNVLDTIPAPTRLLRIAGAEHVPLIASVGVEMTTVVAYESISLRLPDPVANVLEEPCVVLLHSAVAGSHFANECARLGLDRTGIAIAALGPRIADAAGEGWSAVHISPVPRDRDLLEMIAKLCL